MNDAKKTLRERLAANWTSTPIKWTNIDFDPANPGPNPNDPPNDWPANGSWIHFDENIPSQSFQASIGATQNIERTIGAVQIDVFTPAGDGLAASNQLVTALKDLFRWFTAQGVIIRSPDTIELMPDGTFYRVTLQIDFQEDNLHTAAS